MSADWNLVTLEHVKQACTLHDAGTRRPSSPARHTILLLNGNRYPAKFVRGLAYTLAMGRAPGNFNGGLDTVRFFNRMGLMVEHDGTVIPPRSSSAPATFTLPAQTDPVPTPPSPTKVAHFVTLPVATQKQALFALLMKRFGDVKRETNFSWLVVPESAALGTVRSIHEALVAHRGHQVFTTSGKQLNCDFHVPGHRLLIEYDERQHFTLPRGIALRLYPTDLPLHFDRQDWIATCERIKASDKTPSYRDEQRSFYDTLRDIRAAENGYILIRLKDGAIDWNRPEAGDALDRALYSAGIPDAGSATALAASRIRRIALISHDYRQRDSAGLWDYSEHFGRINRLCDDQGCDTILYALYTWDSRSRVRRPSADMFDQLNRVNHVVIESGNLRPMPAIPMWNICESMFGIAEKRSRRYFGRTLPDPKMPSQRAGHSLVMICGETNITSLVRKSRAISDPYQINSKLTEYEIDVILNPIHDYMRRYEMKEKRRYFSTGKRWITSVWNRGKGKESSIPWTVYYDGAELTNSVTELATPFADRPDIRIGVIELSEHP